LFGSVNICGLAGHEIEETVKLDIAAGIGVDNRKDTLEVNLSLLVLSNTVAKGDQAVLELLWVKTASSGFVKVVEGCTEFIKLFLCDTLAVTGQDLVLDFIDGPVNRCDQLLPSHPKGFHGVLCIFVFKTKLSWICWLILSSSSRCGLNW